MKKLKKPTKITVIVCIIVAVGIAVVATIRYIENSSRVPFPVPSDWLFRVPSDSCGSPSPGHDYYIYTDGRIVIFDGSSATKRGNAVYDGDLRELAEYIKALPNEKEMEGFLWGLPACLIIFPDYDMKYITIYQNAVLKKFFTENGLSFPGSAN